MLRRLAATFLAASALLAVTTTASNAADGDGSDIKISTSTHQKVWS